MILKPAAKLALTFVLFLLALGTVAAAAAIHRAGPLFFAWFPLLAVAWVLTRPEEQGPVGEAAVAPEVSSTDAAGTSADDAGDSTPDAEPVPDPTTDEGAGAVTHEAPPS